MNTPPIRLRLYVAGRTVSAERARTAIHEIERIITAKLGADALVVEIVDALALPESAARDDVFATPTLIRISPGPVLRLFGDISNVEKVVAAFGLNAVNPPPQILRDVTDCDSLAGVA